MYNFYLEQLKITKSPIKEEKITAAQLKKDYENRGEGYLDSRDIKKLISTKFDLQQMPKEILELWKGMNNTPYKNILKKIILSILSQFKTQKKPNNILARLSL